MLKELIYEWTGIPIQHQTLSFGGNRLEDQKTLRDHGVQQDSTINVAKSRGNESPSATEIGRHTTMGPLELDHFGYLLGKMVNTFRQGKEPQEEVTRI